MYLSIPSFYCTSLEGNQADKTIPPDSSVPPTAVNDCESASLSSEKLTSKSNLNAKPEEVNVFQWGYFFPECWTTEFGHTKPKFFSNLIQALAANLLHQPGVTLSKFAIRYQNMFGQQAVRRLVFVSHLQSWSLFRHSVSLVHLVNQKSSIDIFCEYLNNECTFYSAGFISFTPFSVASVVAITCPKS